MSYLRVAAVTILCTFALAMTQAPQPEKPVADLTGNWSAVFETPIGEMRYLYDFKMTAEGVLTGNANGSLGNSAISEGRVKGNTVTFVEMLDGSIKITYTGAIVSKDELKFSRVVGDFGTEEAVARRVPAAK